MLETAKSSPNCRDRLHDWLLRIVRALTAPISNGTHVPVEEVAAARSKAGKLRK